MNALFIDIGSNTIKSLLASKGESKFTAIAEFSVPKRISANGKLADDAFQIIVSAVDELRKKAQAVLPNFESFYFGTSALRDLSGAKEVLEKLNAKGIFVKVLSGNEEAEYSFKGACLDAALNLQASADILFADIGGGSMEFLFAQNSEKILYSKSLPLGAVKLTNLFFKNGNLDFKALEDFCFSQLGKFEKPKALKKFVISGGAITAARFILGNGKMSEQNFLQKTDILKVLEIVKSLSAQELSLKYGTPKNRADILPAAFVCILCVLEYFEVQNFYHTQYSLRYGMAQSVFEANLKEI